MKLGQMIFSFLEMSDECQITIRYHNFICKFKLYLSNIIKSGPVLILAYSSFDIIHAWPLTWYMISSLDLSKQ